MKEGERERERKFAHAREDRLHLVSYYIQVNFFLLVKLKYTLKECFTINGIL